MTKMKAGAGETDRALEQDQALPGEPARAPAAERPRTGGSYVRDRATGKLTRMEA